MLGGSIDSLISHAAHRTYNPPQLIYHKVAVKLDAFLDTYLTSHVIPEN
jgi:hypothetical protein